MVQPFDRIVRDFSKFGGQAYIVQTGITVNQILALSVQGASIEEILAEFPQLSSDDIHQALSFALNDVFKAVSYWRHDGITPLTQIKGYSEILVGKTDFDDLDTIPTEQKHQWMSIIHSSSQRGIASWQHMSQWLRKSYFLNPDAHTEVYELEQFIMDMVKSAQNYEPVLQINVSPIDPRVTIEVHSDTAVIMGGILAFSKNTFQPETFVILETAKESIIIELHRQLLYPDDDLEKTVHSTLQSHCNSTFFFSYTKYTL